MYIFDEETIIGDTLTPETKSQRRELVAQLPNVSAQDMDDVDDVQTRTEIRIELDGAVSVFDEVNISMDCPLAFNGSRIRIYDGMVDAFSETKTLLQEIGTPPEDGLILLIRLNPPVLSDKPIVLSDDVVTVFVSDIVVSERYTALTVVYNLAETSEQLSKDIEDRIMDALSENEEEEEVSRSTSGIKYHVSESSAQINTAVFNHLVMNDPVMSLLYAVSGYKNLKQKLRLVRRNKRNDFVELVQLKHDRVGIFFSVKDASETNSVLKKILASIQYYTLRKESVERFYEKFSVRGRRLLTGFNLDQTVSFSAISQIRKNSLDITRADLVLRTKLDCAVAMQNNPGISFDSLKKLSQVVRLDPRRWCDAAGAGNNLNIYLFSEKGMIVPRSRLGLYRRKLASPPKDAIFVFVKKNGHSCMLLVKKKDNSSGLKLNKKVGALNQDYTFDRNDFKLACVPPAIKSVLGSKYLVCPVFNGDGPTALLQCVKSAREFSENNNFTSIFPVDSRDAKQAEEMLSALSLFYVGGNTPVVPSTPPNVSEQTVDGHGKNCGIDFVPTSVSAPIPKTKVQEMNRRGGNSLVDRFAESKRGFNFKMQICLFAFSLYLHQREEELGGAGLDALKGVGESVSLTERMDAHAWLIKQVDEFAKKHLFSDTNSVSVFHRVLKKNNLDRIPVPDVEAMTFFLMQSTKEPEMLLGYINRIFIEDYFPLGTYREKSTLCMPTTHFSTWQRQHAAK